MCKKVLTIIISLVLIFSSCERKPLYLSGDCKINVNVTTQVAMSSYIDTYWNPSWKDSLIYDWSKTGEELGYTFPEDVDLVIFDGNRYYINSIKTNRRQLLDIELNKTYNFLIYNNNSPYIAPSYTGGRYYIETPVIQSSGSVLDNNYETCLCPGDIFSTYIKNIYLSDNVNDYDEVYEDGKLIYVYNIDADIVPVSYIYIIQFIFINDDHSERIEAKDICNFTISGISSKKNLFTGEEVYTGKKQVQTSDVKPGQIIEDSLVFASRITILGLLPEDNESSWSTYHNYLYYTGIDVTTYTYGSVKGIIDITKQLNDNPKGGIITVRILNSELKKHGNKPAGFGIDIDEWENQVIDIPF